MLNSMTKRQEKHRLAFEAQSICCGTAGLVR